MVEFRKVAIIGGGTFGRGIAESVSRAGLNVVIIDKDTESVSVSRERLGEELNSEIDKWGMTVSDKRAILNRIEFDTDYDRSTTVEVAIESALEEFEVKVKILLELEKNLSSTALIATNTATLSITELAAKMTRPERLIGIHFHYPVAKRALVELVRGLKTSQEVYDTARAFIKTIKKESVEVFEYPGYITTRGILPFLNEAMHIVMEGVASVQDVDKAMKLAYDLRTGPLELADHIGLDKVLFWMEHLFQELGEPRFRPCPIVRKMVRAGNLGKKTGQGFYRYQGDKKEIIS